MTILFSKSPETYEKIIHTLDVLLNEQRHQRADLATVKRQLHTLLNLLKLQKQVDEYFDRDESTSLQTDTEEQLEHGTDNS